MFVFFFRLMFSVYFYPNLTFNKCSITKLDILYSYPIAVGSYNIRLTCKSAPERSEGLARSLHCCSCKLRDKGFDRSKRLLDFSFPIIYKELLNNLLYSAIFINYTNINRLLYIYICFYC